MSSPPPPVSIPEDERELTEGQGGHRVASARENEELVNRLQEAEDTLRAIRCGEVDAVVVNGPSGDQIYTLKGADEPYRLLIERMQEGALTLNEEGMILYCNPFFSGGVGKSPRHLMGRSLAEFLLEEDRNRFFQLLAKARSNPVSGRVTLVTAQGAVPIKLSLSAISTMGFRGICAIATNLTEHEEKERAMASYRLTRAVLEAASEAVLVCDDAGMIVRANRKALELFAEDCLDRPLDAVCPLGQPFADLKMQSEEARSGLEVRYERSPATVYYLSLGVRPLEGSELRARGWVITLSDITQRKDMEQALRKSETELKHQAEQLKRADRRKDEFLAILGHELRNPVAGIANGIALLRRGGASIEDQQWTQKMIGDQVRQLTHLLNDLLDIGRITQDKIRLQMQSVDLATVIKAAVASARRVIENYGHTFSVNIPTTPICVRADPTRLEQIVVNLLTNAAKYTDRGGTIRLDADTDDSEVRIRVRDDGVGLASDMLDRIFEPFMQVRQENVYSGGLGIGLTLVRKLVELHGGRVNAFSEGRGRGSEFVVHLPSVQSEPGVHPEIKTTPAIKKGLRVLIVDDNADAARGMELLLLDAGCDVRVAVNGATALETARHHRPEVVLLDIGLPDIGGCDVAKRLHTQNETDEALLIAITGFGNQEARHMAAQAGFHHYLVKPIDYVHLFTLLQSKLHITTAPSGDN